MRTSFHLSHIEVPSPPALCGFQLPVSGQIHYFFWFDSEKREWNSFNMETD